MNRVQSERVFSTAGAIDTTQRSNKNPSRFTHILFKRTFMDDWFFNRRSSILVFNFRKKIVLLHTRLTILMHSSQECVSSIVSSETQSIKTYYISLFN